MQRPLNLYLFTLLGILALPLAAEAQEKEPLSTTVDGQAIEYTDVLRDIQDVTSYYRDEVLVLSTQDINGNGTTEVWVLYGPDLSIVKELRDTDGDGEPDVFVTFDTQENVTDLSGQGLSKFEAVTNEVGNETPQSSSEMDYAGDLEDIERLAGESGGFSLWLFLLLILLVIGTWWKYKKPH